MRSTLRTALLALILATAPVLTGGVSHASPVTGTGTAAVAMAAAAEQSGTAGSLVPLAGYTLTASPSDTASTAPANPGTGESAEEEATRLDFAPWVIGGIALATLLVVLIWRRRRGNTTIV